MTKPKPDENLEDVRRRQRGKVLGDRPVAPMTEADIEYLYRFRPDIYEKLSDLLHAIVKRLAKTDPVLREMCEAEQRPYRPMAVTRPRAAKKRTILRVIRRKEAI